MFGSQNPLKRPDRWSSRGQLEDLPDVPVYLLAEAVAAHPEAHVDRHAAPWLEMGGCEYRGCARLQRRPEIHVMQIKAQLCDYIKAGWSPDADRRASQAHTRTPRRRKFSTSLTHVA